VLASAAGDGGVAILARGAACQRSGQRAPGRANTPRRYANGSTSTRWHLDVNLYISADCLLPFDPY
jgi:hypothetical protein